ncbi:MAG: hypothetical protein PHI93_08850 [Kiritimatiellae bacterium]|nr:hypothetical protein [Kiritimatiellia bacterium]
MKNTWRLLVLLAVALGVGHGDVWAQEEVGESSASRLLTLQASAVLDGLDKVHVELPLAARLPDFRLKVVQPDMLDLTADVLEPQLRGIELQVPRSWIWVGYDWSDEREAPRATFSIQRDF